MSIINKIKIKHFKSIWSDEIEFGQLNVLIGTNGAGKSNILEAIAMASASIEGGIDYEKLHKKGARLSAPDIFRSSFRGRDRNQTFSIGIEMSKISYEFSIRSKAGFSYLSEYIHTNDCNKLAGRGPNGAKIGELKIADLQNDRSIVPLLLALSGNKHAKSLSNLEDFGIYSPSTPILRGSSEDSSKKNVLGLYGGRLAEAFNEVLSYRAEDPKYEVEIQRFFKLFDWFKSVGFTEKINPLLLGNDLLNGKNATIGYKDKFMRNDFNDLYAYDVSEGALFILFVLVLLTHKKTPKIFALDNIDSSLNPGLVRNLMCHVIDILNHNEQKQIFMTTHNPMTLDALDLFNPQHRLFVVERLSDGQTKTRRVSPPEGITKDEWESEYLGMKLSEIWLSGAIGGLPKGF